MGNIRTIGKPVNVFLPLKMCWKLAHGVYYPRICCSYEFLTGWFLGIDSKNCVPDFRASTSFVSID